MHDGGRSGRERGSQGLGAKARQVNLERGARARAALDGNRALQGADDTVDCAESEASSLPGMENMKQEVGALATRRQVSRQSRKFLI